MVAIYKWGSIFRNGEEMARPVCVNALKKSGYTSLKIQDGSDMAKTISITDFEGSNIPVKKVYCEPIKNPRNFIAEDYVHFCTLADLNAFLSY